MKTRLIIFLLSITLSGFAQNEHINLPGFGELPYIKNEGKFSINFDKIGKLDFKGTIDPLSLETTVKMEQLKNIKGYKVISKLSLEDLTIKVSKQGLFLDANANTGGALKTLCEALKITEPKIGISTMISKTGFALTGGLDFSAAPIVIDVAPKIGTRMTLESIELGANVGIEYPGKEETPEEKQVHEANAKKKKKKKKVNVEFSPAIYVRTELRLRPTSTDPDLKIITEFEYDLISQEITGAGSMVDTWSNPLGLSKLLPENSISMTNTAMEIGWIPGSPTPTNIGFYLAHGKFFDLEFAMGLSVAPADGSVALMAERNKMTMNDFTRVLREGFKLNVPDVFPQDMYIENAKVLFAPTGGEVGEFEIEEGFAIKGKAKLLNAMQGELDFKMNGDDGFYLDLKMDANFKEAIMNEISKVKYLTPVMGKVLNTFEVRKIYLHLEASTDLVLQGETNCHFKVMGKDIKFTLKGKLDVNSIKNKLIEEIKKVAGPEVAAAIEAVNKALNQSKEIASKAFGDASQLIGTAAKHVHTKETCDKTCVPNLARNMTRPVYLGSREAIISFYNNVIDDVANIEGIDENETKKLRVKFIRPKWDELNKKIDEDFSKIWNDKTYVKYYVLPSSATNGGNIFRGIVENYEKLYNKLKNDLWTNMMYASYYPMRNKRRGLRPNVAFEWEKSPGTYEGLFLNEKNISNEINVDTSFHAGSIVLMSENKKYILKFRIDGNLVLYKYNDIPLKMSDTKGADKLIFHEKGYLFFKRKNGQSIPSSLKTNMGDTKLRLKNDGNLEVVNGKTGRARSFGTAEKTYSNKAWLPAKEWKKGETVLVSKNRKYSLELDYDGNLKLMKYGVFELWSSGTTDKGVEKFVFQDDGNLVLYGFRNKVIWSPNCYNKGGETLALEDDGSLVIHAPGAKVIWKAVNLKKIINSGRFLKLKNSEKPTYLNVEKGISCGQIAPGWHSAQWVFEPVEGTDYMKIKNRWKNTYLNIEHGGVQCGEIAPGWFSAQWQIEPIQGTNQVRIKNRWKETYLNVESGNLQCTSIQPGWSIAKWELEEAE